MTCAASGSFDFAMVGESTVSLSGISGAETGYQKAIS
jgi:hypothetical protein